jgi:hypothetical protein
LVSHGMTMWQHTFVGIGNCQVNMEALLNDQSSILVHECSIGLFGNRRRQSSHATLHCMLSNSSMKVATLPVHLNVGHTFQYLIDSSDNIGKLQDKYSMPAY